MIFGKRLLELTFADVKKAVLEIQEPESILLDYKSGVRAKPQEMKEDFAKDVSSFANHYGGVLVYGVKEKDRVPESIFGIKNAQMIRDQIVAICASPTYLQPPIFIADPIILSGEVDNEKKDIVLVEIQQSEAVPHFFMGSTKFYIRSADTNQPVEGSPELLELYRNRREKNELLKRQQLEEAKNLSFFYFKDTYDPNRLKTSIDQIRIPMCFMCLQPQAFDRTAINGGQLREALLSASEKLRKRFPLLREFDNYCINRNSDSYSATVVFRMQTKTEDRGNHAISNTSWTSMSTSGMLYHFEDMPLEIGRENSKNKHSFSPHLVLRKIYSFLFFANECFQMLKKHFAFDLIIEFYNVSEMQMLDVHEKIVPNRRVIQNHFSIRASLTTYDLNNKDFIDHLVLSDIAPELLRAINFMPDYTIALYDTNKIRDPFKEDRK